MPDETWYDVFYGAVEKSGAYAEYCLKTFGVDFSQQGFSSMEQIAFLLDTVRLRPGQRVLDMGCGNGKLVEYMADAYGILGEGFDISSTAIHAAKRRTKNKADQLSFRVGSINDIAYDKGSMDVVLSVDTLYFSEDLNETVQDVLGWLKSGGCFAAYYSEFRFSGGEPLEKLTPDGTALAMALRENHIPYTVHDFTRNHYDVMRRKKNVLSEMRQAFEEEGTQVLYENAYAESIDKAMGYEDFKKFSTRYLYMIQKE